MTDLPELSESTTRKLAVQWDTIRDDQKLTDEDLTRYDRARQRLSGQAAGRYELHPSVRQGLSPSITAAELRFRQKEIEYWSLWCSSGAPWEKYAATLDSLKRDIVAEFESIWKGRSAKTDRWFQSTCAPAIEKALASLVNQRIAQARAVEVKRLEVLGAPLARPGNPLLDEILAGGERARRVISNLSPQTREAIRRGDLAELVRAAAGREPQNANPARTAEPSGDESTRTGAGPLTGPDSNGADRRAAVDAYIEEVFSKTGKRITRTDIWKLARYKTRTEFERWERHDPRATKAATKRFSDILAEKPHLK